MAKEVQDNDIQNGWILFKMTYNIYKLARGSHGEKSMEKTYKKEELQAKLQKKFFSTCGHYRKYFD